MISIFLYGVWDYKSLFQKIEKTASITSQSNCLKFGLHPLEPFYLSFFLCSLGKSGTGVKMGLGC